MTEPRIPTPCDIPWMQGQCDAAGDAVGDAVGGAIGKVGGSIVDQVSADFAKAAVEILKMLTTLWIDPKIGPDGKDYGRLLNPRLSEAADDPLYFLAHHTGWLVTWVAVLGVLLAAGRLAWTRRAEPFREMMSGLVTLAVVVMVGSQAVNMALIAGDAYSQWIIDASTTGDVTGNLGKLTASGFFLGGTGGAVVLIISLLAILSAVVQIGMMFVRGAMVVLLAGLLPMAAAMSVAPDGRQWWRKMVGWLLAFVLYKPVAATVYAVAFKSLMGDSIAQLQGIVLVILAVATLPALMRFIVPLVSATAGGGSGGALAGAGAGALAMGARMVPALGGSSSGKGGKAGSAGRDGKDGKDGKDGPTGGGQPGKQDLAQHTKQGAQGGPKAALVGAGVDAVKAPGKLSGKVTKHTIGDEEGPRGSG